ncbi:MAG TPA: R3H domain-containing nucleic acid-binding protein [Candidatus Limnocylindria bacterium]|jgi:stage III sporulation protein SpoIIIAA|nr:R3H domain-containing nucleic acid-binding protein [Candidatus Limnocylindria bacterium]
MQQSDELEALLRGLPPDLAQRVRALDGLEGLLEIVMDLGRLPEARFAGREEYLSQREVSAEDLAYVISHIGQFGGDNRAGIERTLHRISALRNRAGKVVGLTLRVGRAVYGTVEIIRDIVESGRSILLLGRPGVGKTTMLREVARVLADDLAKRVVIVDTSNEIAGDGDIPHPGIGRARRMQVPTPSLQHAVMIEAVENHMPEVVVIDEIGTEQEAAAARTIAERGVQLIATAHGNTLENLMLNPTLTDLVGGIQTVTLSDEEARRRGTQKSVLERKAPPTFQVLVEIQAYQRVAIYHDVSQVVDAILLGMPVAPEIRSRTETGEIARTTQAPTRAPADAVERRSTPRVPLDDGLRETIKVYPFGVSWARVEDAARGLGMPVAIVREPEDADVVLTLKNYYRRKTPRLRNAESAGIPIYIARSNSSSQIASALASVIDLRRGPEDQALEEAREAIEAVASGQSDEIELAPQNAYVRRLQHELAERASLSSRSTGHEPVRRVQIYR